MHLLVEQIDHLVYKEFINKVLISTNLDYISMLETSITLATNTFIAMNNIESLLQSFTPVNRKIIEID